AAIEPLLVQYLPEAVAGERDESIARPRCLPEDRASRAHQERRLVLEEHGFLHPAGFGEHQPPPQAVDLVVVVGEVVAHLAAEVIQHPAVDGARAWARGCARWITREGTHSHSE